MLAIRHTVCALSTLLYLVLAACSSGDSSDDNTGGSSAPPTVARSTAGCAVSSSSGGDWPAAGHDARNTRNQTSEKTIGTGNVNSLQPVWHLDTGNASGILDGVTYGDINSTPIVADGCVYLSAGGITEDSFNLFAVNADTGELVWKAQYVTNPSGPDGAVIGSPVVSGGRLIVLVNQEGDGPTSQPQSGTVGPHLLAFNPKTGALLWQSAPIVTGAGYYTHATPIVERGVIVAGFSPVEGDSRGQGGVALLDERTGNILRMVYTVPENEWGTEEEPRFAGGGVWTTPAAEDGYVYYGTGNPFSKEIEHPNTNAILKVDVDRRRSTFGKIVAGYKGNVEQLNDLLVLASRPTCILIGDSVTIPGTDVSGCLQLDLDFGASPNLFPGPDGELLVGDLQKSGVYHAARTSDMSPAWTILLNATCTLCNGASTAYDDALKSIFVNVSPTSLLYSVSNGGALLWASPDLNVINYEAVSMANGVVYLVDALGSLLAFDARSGTLLLIHPTLLESTDPSLGINSAGVAIARNTVYVPAGSHLIAYRLP